MTQYIVSIDDNARDIHFITIIYAENQDEARAAVKKEAPLAIIGVYEKFPTILIEDGTNYVLSAWKPLKCKLIVARQREKVIALQNELERERAKLAEFEEILQREKEEAEAVPLF